MSEIAWTPVTSGHIDAVAHDGDETLFVRYKDHKEFGFMPVSFDTFNVIVEAPSVGRAVRDLGIKGVRL